MDDMKFNFIIANVGEEYLHHLKFVFTNYIPPAIIIWNYQM